jgi:hypothetical protein
MTTAVATTGSPTFSSNTDNSVIGVVIGAVIGVSIVIVLVLILVALLMRYRKGSQRPQKQSQVDVHEEQLSTMHLTSKDNASRNEEQTAIVGGSFRRWTLR